MKHRHLATLTACLLAPALLGGCQREAPQEATAAPTAPAASGMDAPATDLQPPMPTTTPQAFQCGDRRVEVAADADGAEIDLGDRQVTLVPMVVASGARYAGEGVEWWGKGLDEARLTVDGDSYDCVSTEARSPWSEARGRDVGFRAVGSEPGWHVEVDMGEAPAIAIVLDYGERRLDLATSEPFGDDASGESGYRGEADGEAVELLIRREDCSDPMSGEAFEASALLQLGDSSYQGCGRFLWE